MCLMHVACVDGASAVVVVALLPSGHLLPRTFCTTEYVLLGENKRMTDITVRGQHVQVAYTVKPGYNEVNVNMFPIFRICK